MRPETRVSEHRPSRLIRTTFLAADYFSDLLENLKLQLHAFGQGPVDKQVCP